jgi:tetratricopeptide (TPR) repeat protein
MYYNHCCPANLFKHCNIENPFQDGIMSPKIRKKDPCLCGSGKRYRDCCFKERKYSDQEVSKINEKPQPKEDFEESLEEPFDDERLEEMSTESIIDELKSMGVEFDEEQFKTLAQNYISTETLVRECYFPEKWDGKGVRPDEDFIWLAITELWERILPERYNTEMFENAMWNGYELFEDGNYTEGLKEWERAWTVLKCIIPSHFKSIEEADGFMPSSLVLSVLNWCQDFDDELYNGGIEDKSWLIKRIAYTREFCQRFPETGGSIIPHMIKAEAESYFLLGDREKADIHFEQLIEKFPNYVWAYISWGGYYWFFGNENPDYEKAERIYRLGLEHCTSGKGKIRGWLKDLEKERNKSEKRKN